MLQATWRFCDRYPPLWASINHSKYGFGSSLIPSINTKKPGSNFWKGLCLTWDIFQPHSHCGLGNGSSIKFWHDYWVEGFSSLASIALLDIPKSLLETCVEEFVDLVDGRMLDNVKEYLPKPTIRAATYMNPSKSHDDPNRLRWKGNADGSFSLKSTYEIYCNLHTIQESKLFKLVHRWNGPERIHSFLWKLSHESVLTNARRLCLGFSETAFCHLCHGGEKSLFHHFRDYHDIRVVWQFFV